MIVRLFGLYVLVEVLAVIALASAVGVGWTLLIVVATFALGLAVAGSQLRRQLGRLRSVGGPRAIGDGVLVALGTVLVVLPGLVSSVLGLLLLAPPTRAVARPGVAALLARRRVTIAAGAPGFGSPRFGTPGPGAGYAPRRPAGDWIEGEVIDVTENADTPPAGPSGSAGRPGLPRA